MSLLVAGVSILFANDSAVLILTPIVLEIIVQLKIDAKGRMALSVLGWVNCGHCSYAANYEQPY